MSAFDAMVIFAVLWWLVFFILLPVGVRVPEEQEAGHASSAPSMPRIKQKMLWTTLIALVLTAACYMIFAIGGLTWESILGVEAFRW